MSNQSMDMPVMKKKKKQVLAPDINNSRPAFEIPLNKVGILNVIQQVKLKFGKNVVTIPAEFNIWVELPSTYRAAHLSRNLEALKKVLWKQDEHQLRLLSINNIGSKIVNQLLLHHPYSTKVHIDLSLDYFSKRFSPERNIINNEPFRITLGATSIRKSKKIITKHSLQVIVKGATTCPCAQNQSKFITLQKMKKLEIDIDDKLIENLIFPTHMQRAVVIIRFEDMDDNNLDIENLITIAENSMSNSTQSLLKRDDEEQLIRRAFLNPKFVEDVVRAAAYSIALYPKKLGKDTKIYISTETQESIHKHDAFSEIFITYLDLKNYK